MNDPQALTKEKRREALQSYYADAASWNQDRLNAMRSSQRIAWLVAAGAALIALFEAAALVLLTPLKTVVPYTLMVDKTTGYVEALQPLDPAKIAPDTALTQSFLVQYVIARESFDSATVSADYRKVALLSSGGARSSYLASIQASNPQSPLVAYPRGTSIATEVKSVSPMGPEAALVRFDTIRTDPNGQQGPRSAWVAVVRYHYSGEPMSLADRFVNPLGFQVTSYRKDPEALPQGIAPAAPAPQPPAVAASLPTVSAQALAPAPATGPRQ